MLDTDDPKKQAFSSGYLYDRIAAKLGPAIQKIYQLAR